MRWLLVLALVGCGGGGDAIAIPGTWTMTVVDGADAVVGTFRVAISVAINGACETPYDAEEDRFVLQVDDLVRYKVCGLRRDVGSGETALFVEASYPKGICLDVGCVTWLSYFVLKYSDGTLSSVTSLHGPGAMDKRQVRATLRR